MTAKRSNGAHAPEIPFPISPIPAASFLLSQRVALEAARFWARRMRAYADQMEVLASCKNPGDLAGAHSQFLDRMREDYASEGETMTALIKPAFNTSADNAETRSDA